jgi:hypothetical protein
MKRAKTGRGRARKKQKRNGKDDAEEWATSEEGSGSDDEERQNDSESDDAVDCTPVKTRAKGRAPAPSGGGSKSAPKWAEMAKEGLLDSVTLGMRTDWKELVDLWWGLEEKSSFASSVSVTFSDSLSVGN